MAELSAVELAVARIARALESQHQRFALVGGLAVSVRAEVRFTRDVDIAVAVPDDPAAEELVYRLGGQGYRVVASVEHELRKRLATIRLLGAEGVKVDLLFASCGIEAEIADRATVVDVASAGGLPVACAEELLAMKVLSMTDTRLQDRIDAQRLIQLVSTLDLARVGANLDLITQRGFNREEDLRAKLEGVVADVRRRKA